METKQITTTNWFTIGRNAFFADKNVDFLIVRDQSPWKVYYREYRYPGDWLGSDQETATFGGDSGWVLTDTDGARVERYMKSYARPETWEEMSPEFEAKHEVGMICDGASLTTVNHQPGIPEKRIHYFMDTFPEALHPSYQRARRLLRYLEGMVDRSETRKSIRIV